MRRGSLSGLIVFCILLVLLTLTGGCWFLLVRMRETALRGAEATLQNAALIVESAVNRQLLEVDGALVSLPTLFSTVAKDGGAIDAAAASRLLRGINFQTFAYRDIILTRADGSLWASARPNPWNGSFPGRLLKHTDTELDGAATVEGPLRNPVTGDWVLLVVRQVAVPGAGVLNATAEVPLPLMASLFSAVGEIPGLRITLERRDGQLLISQPYDEMQIGKRQQAMMSLIRANGVAFLMPREMIGAPKIAVMRASLYPGVMVALTLDLKTALTDWVRDRDRIIAVVTVAVILLSALALTLVAARRQRERADTERSRARAVLESAIESMSDGFVMWDSADRLVLCNHQYREMYRVSAEFIRPGAKFEDVIREGAKLGQYPNVGGDIEAFVQATVAWHLDNDGPIERELPNGRWALITERKTSDGGRVGIRTDITSLKHALADLAEANDRAKNAMKEVQLQNLALRERDRAMHIQNVLFDAALNNMSQGLLMSDSNQRLIVHNRRFLDMFAIDPATFPPDLPTSDVFARMGTAGVAAAAMAQEVHLKHRSLAEARQSGTFIVTASDGRSISVSQRPLADGGWVATYEDVSEQRRAEEHIRFAAHHDSLTKLPNRVLFRTRLDEMISKLPRRDCGLAVLYLDLDKFKHVNDTLGHPVGDALLEAAGKRLLTCVRGCDVVARLGGDEFALAYVSADLPGSAEHLAARIISMLSEPYNLTRHTVIVGASVGIALSDDNLMSADTLLKNADMALYQAKAKGRGGYSFFEADMERQLVKRLAIEEDLRHALDREEFELFYQPLWDLSCNRIAGFEALIRWNHPVHGTVLPDQFIQIAEETGLIRSIGAWVIRRACTDAKSFPERLKVAVNLSAAQVERGDVVDIVTAALGSSGLPADRLEIEITETTLLKNDEVTLALLFQLRALGVRMALDDFGTGYSSLSYLRTFPFDKIKIDRSFVREMATRQDCAAIVQSIVGLANKLKITTTAEGIETLDQLNLVRETGCTEAQGYLFNTPRRLSDLLESFAHSTPRNEFIGPARFPGRAAA
jgi:diguanylate cyclase (GGDEF)-like protein